MQLTVRPFQGLRKGDSSRDLTMTWNDTDSPTRRIRADFRHAPDLLVS